MLKHNGQFLPQWLNKKLLYFEIVATREDGKDEEGSKYSEVRTKTHFNIQLFAYVNVYTIVFHSHDLLYGALALNIKQFCTNVTDGCELL